MDEQRYSFTNPVIPPVRSGGVYNDAQRIKAESKVPFGNIERALKVQALQASQMQMETIAYRRDIDIKARMGQSEMARFISSNIGTDGFGTESTLKGLYEIANKYAMPDQAIGQYVDQINQSIVRRRLAATLTASAPSGMEPAIKVDERTGQSYQTFSSPTEKTRPADLVVLEEAEKYEGMAEKARESKDPESYKKFKNMAEMRRATLSKSGGTQVTIDDNGRPVVNVGGSVPLGVKSQMMQKESANKVTFSELNKLDSVLEPGHVGVSGTLKENVMNKGLAQFFPDSFDPEASDSRYLIRKVMEGTIKAFASDSRITDQDAKRIAKMLPDTGMMTSFPEVKNAIKNVRMSLKTAMREQAHISGRAIPREAMEPVELRDFYNAQIKQLDSDVEQSKESREIAIEKLKAIQAEYAEALKAATYNAN